MTVDEILELVRRRRIDFVDCRFMDFPGAWQHKIFSSDQLTHESFEQGFGFDGSCVRGWQAVNEADMVLIPVPETARLDPFNQHPTLSLICDVKDPITRKTYSRDPRSIARKAQAYLRSTGIADQAMFAPELEFFMFDRVRFDHMPGQAFYEVDSVEAQWNRGKADPTNMGMQLRLNEGLFPSPPIDTLNDIRGEMVVMLKQMSIDVEGHHHESATAGQCEIDLIHQPLLEMADTCMWLKYVIRNVAQQHGKTATFMPKPLYGDNGSGMHTHFSMWKDGEPLFAGRRYAAVSQLALWAIGGILKHAPAITAFTNSTTNSYKRLVAGYEAPVNLVYSSKNRWAAIRIPRYSDEPAHKRLEIRFPDPAANPYLAFAAITMAAIDGIQNQIDPADPLDKDIEDMTEQEKTQLAHAPRSLEQALGALAADHDFLLAGDVFNKDLINYWIRYKQREEVDAMAQRPHPYEFCMYFDI